MIKFILFLVPDKSGSTIFKKVLKNKKSRHPFLT